jgi:acetyl-CoA carboxylase carboxyltransferase component
MRAIVDQDGGWLERWHAWRGAETAIVWDTHLGGIPISLIGIESRPRPRSGGHPPDGPAEWTAGTLFPLSSKKIARALHAASGLRPVVLLVNLSGFDGSPESLRELQLEHGAQIARAVVEFEGPVILLVVSRYHGGAYVVFSRELNPQLRVAALRGSYASVIGGAAAAKVIFARDARRRAAARDLGERRETTNAAFQRATLEAQAEIAAEFDAVHTVERARDVGSIHDILEPSEIRPYLIAELERALAHRHRRSVTAKAGRA